MGLSRDRWVEVTPSRFAHEREGLEYVRAALPDQDPYRVWTGVEVITDRGRSLDVDLLVIAPAGLFVVELKAYSGTITGDRYSWAIRHERGVRTESNPWRLNNAKAKELKSILRDTLRRQTPHSRPDPNAVIWTAVAVLVALLSLVGQPSSIPRPQSATACRWPHARCRRRHAHPRAGKPAQPARPERAT